MWRSGLVDHLEELLDHLEDGASEASLLNGAVADVGSSTWSANAEAPAGVVDLGAALSLALLQLVLAAGGGLALREFGGATLRDAALQVVGLGGEFADVEGVHGDE